MRKQAIQLITAILSAGASTYAASADIVFEPNDTATVTLKEVRTEGRQDSCHDEPAVTLKEVSVEGRRDSRPVESAVPMMRLDQEKMLLTGVTDISDAMKRLPGVNLRDYGGSGGMKTVSMRGLGTQHTGVVYDGAMLSDVQGGQIDLSRYSLNNLESISMHIGDSDDIFLPARAVSVANSLVIESLADPDMTDRNVELDARFRAASFATLNPYIRFAATDGKRLGMSLTGEYLHARNDYPFKLQNGAETTKEHRTNSQINLGHAEWNGIWKPRASARLQAKAYWFDNSRHLPGAVRYYNSISHQRLREKNAFGQVSYGMKLNSLFSVKALAKYNWSMTRYQDEDGKYPGGLLDQRYQQREEYVTASLLCLPARGVQLAYAADFWHNSLSSNLATDNHPLRNTVLQSLSAKWNVWRLTAFVKGLLSIIHDKSETLADGKTETQFSPSAAITLQPVKDFGWHLRASYKNIFRMPTFNELYFDHYGSVNLQPEKTHQLNFGTTLEMSPAPWLSSLQITADGYLNNVENKIVAIPYNTFLMRMTNLGHVRVLGMDATVNAVCPVAARHELILTCNYSYQRAVSRTDREMSDWMKQVAYVPLNSGAFSVSWKNPWVNVAFNGAGCSARYSTNNNIASSRVAGYADFGVTLFRDFKLRDVTLQFRADVQNLLDKQYEIIANYPMPGRSFSFSIGVRL